MTRRIIALAPTFLALLVAALATLMACAMTEQGAPDRPSPRVQVRDSSPVGADSLPPDSTLR